MKSALSNIPWKTVRQGVYLGRRLGFSAPVPDVDCIVAEKNIAEVKKEFRSKSMRTGWVLSYHYHGEDANLVRPLYKADKYGDYQLHVRLFRMGTTKTKIVAHTELCPMNHPKGHIKNTNMDVQEGVEMSEDILSDSDTEYSVIEVDQRDG